MIHHYSRLELLAKCPRKYVAKYIHKLPDEKLSAAQDGIELHNLMDRMLTDGPEANTKPESKVGAWARALYPLAPAGALPEISHTFELFGHKAGFKIDWTAADFSRFGDWKTSAAPEWALAEVGQESNVGLLKDSIQANLYAYGFMQVFGLTFVDLEWDYVFKKSGKTAARRHRFELVETEEWLREHVLPLMLTIEYLHDFAEANGPMPLQGVPFDQNECKRRRRDGSTEISCPYLGHCQFKPSQLTKPQLLQLRKPEPKHMTEPKPEGVTVTGNFGPAAAMAAAATYAPMNPDPPQAAVTDPVGPPPSVAAAQHLPVQPPQQSAAVAEFERLEAEQRAKAEDPKPRVEPPPKRTGAKAKLAAAEARIAELETELADLKLERRPQGGIVPATAPALDVTAMCEQLEQVGFQVSLKYIGVVV